MTRRPSRDTRWLSSALSSSASGRVALARAGSEARASRAWSLTRASTRSRASPARAGSSFGITRVPSENDLADAISYAEQFDPKVLIEGAVVGRELECGVLGVLDGGAEASVVGEILVSGDHEFYDFEAKYLAEDAVLAIPAEVPVDVSERVRELSVEAFRVLGCEGLPTAR